MKSVPRHATPSQIAPVLAMAALAAVLGTARADTLELVWQILPGGDRDWMLTNNTTRCVASNPANGNVIVPSGVGSGAQSPPLTVHVLNRLDGQELHVMNLTDVTGGLFPLSLMGVADDGAIYGANLVSPGTPVARQYKIYRWANDQSATVPTVAFLGDPAGEDGSGNSLNPQRWGDTFDVRGSGTNTMIVAGANAANPVAIFTTSDGLNFVPHLVAGVGPANGSLTVAFGEDIIGYDDPGTPAPDNLTLITVYAKRTGQALRRIGIRTDTWQAVTSTLTVYPAAFTSTIGIVGVHVPSKRLGAIDLAAAADNVRAYDITDPLSTPTLLAQQTLPTDNPNTNGVGMVDFFLPSAGEGELRVYYLDTNNGLSAFELQATEVPPEIVTQPGDLTVIEGGEARFEVGVTGSPPLSFEWKQGDVVRGATGTLVISPVTLEDAGSYTVRVSNPANAVTSDPATLTVVPRVDTAVMEECWKLAPGDRPYLASADNAHRGIAYNAELDHLILISRTPVTGLPNPAIVVLDAATGDDLGPGGTVRTLSLSAGGQPVVTTTGVTFPLNLVGCSDDGVVYSSNLVVASQAANFAIYQWPNDAEGAEPRIAYGPADIFTGDRAGDSFDVRGGGVQTQILVGARNFQKFAVLTTVDGLAFTPHVFDVADTAATDFAQVTFGEGDTIWAKSEAGPLRMISFNLGTNSATVEHSFTTDQFPAGARSIAVDPTTHSLGAVAIETPDNLRLYDITDPATPPVLLDQEFFLTDFGNGNFTGAVKFGAGRIYGLDTNNGIIAMKVNRSVTPTVPPVIDELNHVVAAGGDTFEFVLKGEVGKTYVVQTSPSLADESWTDLAPVIEMTAPEQPVSLPLPADQDFLYFRVREQ